MIYKQGDVLELKDGKVCTVVQVQQRREDYVRYYCLEGTEPPKNVPPEQWPFIGVSPDEIRCQAAELCSELKIRMKN